MLGYKHRINYSTVLEEYNFESEILKKIYIQEDNIHFVPFDFIFENVDLKKTIFLSDYAAIAVINDTYIPVYLCSNVVYDEKKYDIKKYHQFYANVEYNLNYDNNDIYFIDDYDNELISYIPQEPEREGYTFGGWYKESECINKWDFSNDIIKEKKWFNDNKEYYKDQDYEKTTLYAKWI